MRILTICPSVNNRDKITKSFFNTIREDNHLFFCSDGTVTEAINGFFYDVKDYDFVHITNDDVIYETPGWDTILTSKYGINYANDTLQGENLCTFPVISSEIIQAVGWIQLPTLNRYYGDTVWHTIGKDLNILNYFKDVIIRHKHSKDLLDFSKYTNDTLLYYKWLQFDSLIDTHKIKAVLNGK